MSSERPASGEWRATLLLLFAICLYASLGRVADHPAQRRKAFFNGAIAENLSDKIELDILSRDR